jgi:hypothetical protein
MFWKKIHGINLWKLNRTLIKVAYSKISLEEQISDDKIKIYFKSRKTNNLFGIEFKKEIEESIRKLEGFETLKLCLLEDCIPEYKEQRFYDSVNHWIEIHILHDKQVNQAS